MQDEDAHIGPGRAGGKGLAVRPHAEHGIVVPRVVLGDDQDLQVQVRWVASVRWESEALR